MTAPCDNLFGKGKRAAFMTLGCKVSQYETEAVAERFERCGYEIVPFSEPSDVYVINTCTVTAEADRKSRQMIRRAKSVNPDSVVLVCGCYSQRSSDEVAAIDGVDAVIGSGGKMSLPDIAERLIKSREKYVLVTDIDKEPFEPMRITRGPRTRVYVKIEDGCESRCAYCAIPSARGRVRSKSRLDVIAEVEALGKSGVKEIVLTGIETGSYGADFEENYRLPDLIAELDERGSAERIRLGSLAPELITERFVEVAGKSKILMPHFHLSQQSGSDAVLRLMKRRYNRNMAMSSIKRLRAALPRATFTTDLMVGFPGESDADFLDTVSFAKEARFLDAHVFSYSKRHGTPAIDYPNQVPENIKKKRSEELIREVASIRDSVISEIFDSGEPLSVLFEQKKDGMWHGHSDNFVEVAVRYDGELHGDVASVIPKKISNGVIIGEIK